jgi:NADP-dependent alcohol dehydrogenase
MENFEFYNPVKILFGKGQIASITAEIPKGTKIALLFGGGSIFRNGVYDQVKEAINDYQVVEFGGIEPNPLHETCMEAVELIRNEKAGFILAVGGGSVIDAAKYIAAAVHYTGDPWDIMANHGEIHQAVPLGTVLTLPATGTEMNANSVISKEETGEKLAFSHKKVMPVFSVLDPETAASLPQKQVANGIVDSFVHVLEQYLTYPANAPLQDRIAESILLTLIEEGPKAYKNPADYDSMANLMWCSTMALNGLISCGVPGDWVTHQIGHELTAYHGIDHARTLAVVMPGVWSVFRSEKKEKLIQYGKRIWGVNESDEEKAIETAIEKTVSFFESLGIATRLPAYEVPAETIEKIVDRFRKREWLAIGDRQLTTPEKVREILDSRL